MAQIQYQTAKATAQNYRVIAQELRWFLNTTAATHEQEGMRFQEGKTAMVLYQRDTCGILAPLLQGPEALMPSQGVSRSLDGVQQQAAAHGAGDAVSHGGECSSLSDAVSDAMPDAVSEGVDSSALSEQGGCELLTRIQTEKAL